MRQPLLNAWPGLMGGGDCMLLSSRLRSATKRMPLTQPTGGCVGGTAVGTLDVAVGAGRVTTAFGSMSR